MSDDGYTLAETLAALVVFSLAIGGLIQGLSAVNRIQRNDAAVLAQSRAQARAQAALASLFEHRGPYRSTDRTGLVGDAVSLRFPCEGATCGAVLADGRLTVGDEDGRRIVRLPMSGDLRFVYYGEGKPLDRWPPAGKEALLSSVGLMAGSGPHAVLASARVWESAGGGCAFGPVLRDCGGTVP